MAKKIQLLTKIIIAIFLFNSSFYLLSLPLVQKHTNRVVSRYGEKLRLFNTFTSIHSVVFAQAMPCTDAEGIAIMIPSGEQLLPGSYDVLISVAGTQVNAQIELACIIQMDEVQPSLETNTATSEAISTIATAEEETIASSNLQATDVIDKAEPTTDTLGQLSVQTPLADASAGFNVATILLAALMPILLIGLGAGVYFKFIQPRRRLAPYIRALEHLKNGEYQTALPLLTDVESKLADNLRQDARFFIAFANMQQKNISEAEHTLNTLLRENPENVQVAYLLAYLYVQRRRYDEAEPLLEQMEEKRQLQSHDAQRLLGIVKFHRGLTALQDGRIEAASTLFAKVQDLGDFADQIPTDLRNRHIALGTKALFEKDLSEARKQFESLQQAQSELPAEQRNSILATVYLGLALADWLDGSSDKAPIIEQRLVDAAKLLAPDDPAEREWPADSTEKKLIDKLDELEREADRTPEDQDLVLCLRELHFLRGMVVLRSWSQMDGEDAHEQIEPQFQKILTRCACAYAYDEDFSDVRLVVGLLKYYIHQPGSPERNRGLDDLQEARKSGVREPDVVEILNNRERIERANADAVDKYLQVLDKYLNDDTVRKEIRISLMEQLSRYRKLQHWEKQPNLTQARTVEPTVAEMRERSKVLRVRVEQILAAQQDIPEFSEVQSLSEALEKEGQQLYEQAQNISNKEAELLAITGNQLLQDE